MTRLKLFIPLLLVAVLGIALFIGLQKDPHQLGLIQQDKPMPAFVADDLLLRNRTFSERDFQGQITVLNVWASWCPSCKSEFSFLKEIGQQGEFTLFGLNYRDTRAAAMKVLNELGNPYFRSVYDPEGKLAMELGVYGTPETYLIDARGVVRYRYSGELNADVWKAEFVPKIEALIKGESRP
ncbi:Cytochrome c biogenesis protein CcmG [Leminorella richardii]|uniref:Thiol:disulfide interchange protein DsbE n=1 Tax=Leminorella richardii TaxID=158841 RepID=A0A2X4UWG2_9GAMM|nr:DsbE family thiol:disulfide interchange protein [Leminorella richardii]SQI44187.1 Cytochrome c biogenesis protein CcmG [Leminorella richardii]